VVSIWEKACDREVLASELNQGYAVTEQALDDGEMVDATLRVDETVALPKGA
jgi:hypothetical protein